jgi:flavin reductase (DIM6/NTAB) family NADH-FMN oxidoreductase RutF
MDPAAIGHAMFYYFLNSVVVPRPIAWVSSRSPDGVDNLAPHSFFNVAAVDPPVVSFTSVGRKDSLNNIEQTREFVVSFAPTRLLEEVNATGTNFPAGVSEFDAVGVEREPSATVAAMRVADSPVALECRLHSTVCFGSDTVVFGRVQHAVIDEDVLRNDRPAIDLLDPVARLGGSQWARVGDVYSITRIDHSDWPGHYTPPSDETVDE